MEVVARCWELCPCSWIHTLCLSFLYHYGLPIVLSPSGLISKVALLCSDCEKNVYIIIHCLVLYQRVFGKYGCKLCFYVLMECFIKKIILWLYFLRHFIHAWFCLVNLRIFHWISLGSSLENRAIESKYFLNFGWQIVFD